PLPVLGGWGRNGTSAAPPSRGPVSAGRCRNETPAAARLSGRGLRPRPRLRPGRFRGGLPGDRPLRPVLPGPAGRLRDRGRRAPLQLRLAPPEALAAHAGGP